MIQPFKERIERLYSVCGSAESTGDKEIRATRDENA
jgi:hypothetical protein